MGLSWSNSNNNNRRRNNYYQTPQFFSSSPPYPYPPDPYSAPLPYPYPAPLPPPANPVYSSHYYPAGYNACNYHNPVMGRAHFGGPAHYYGYQSDGWVAGAPPSVAYVEHQEAKRVKSDVNVHKDTVKIEVDEAFPGRHLVSFVFDALCDGSITIFYFAKEEPSCKVIPVFPESCIPVKIPFQKGLGQKFRQPSGTGINFSFFKSDDISKPSAEDVFPLVISAETCFPSLTMDGYLSYLSANTSPHTQITQAVLEKNNDDPMKVRVIKQILWIDEVRYELREIYGIGNSAQAFSNNDSGKDCVICMTEPKDTAVLPCRHMCMCSECAKELRLQSNKCPICRQSIEELMEIKINYIDQ